VGLANEEGVPHKGSLYCMDNKVSSGTGTIWARGKFDNAKEHLLPGLFVRVRIPYGKPHQAFFVPEKAILRDQKQKFVYVVNSVVNKENVKEDVVEYRQVKLGSLQNGMRAIESGIGPEDRIIVNGSQRARPNTIVAPHEAEKTTGDCPNFRGTRSVILSTKLFAAKMGLSPWRRDAKRASKKNNCVFAPVILSAAKNLRDAGEILRCAQNDKNGGYSWTTAKQITSLL